MIFWRTNDCKILEVKKGGESIADAIVLILKHSLPLEFNQILHLFLLSFNNTHDKNHIMLLLKLNINLEVLINFGY